MQAAWRQPWAKDVVYAYQRGERPSVILERYSISWHVLHDILERNGVKRRGRKAA
jgi:hypothetical protein